MIGADVEVFLNDSGRPKSAIGLIGGSKNEPFVIPNGNLQEDNVMAEMAIDPVDNEEDWIHRLNQVYYSLLDHVQLQPVIEPVLEFPEHELQSPMAREFGCDPDVNAYDMEPNDTVDPSMVGNFRFAGGHIHVGMEDAKARDKIHQAKKMDLFLGVPSVLLDTHDERRSLYGRAGTCRLKSYGVEYRSLSNFWLKSKVLMAWVYRNAVTSLHANTDNVDWEAVRRTIDNSDREAAAQIVDEYGIYMPHCVEEVA